MWYVTFVHFKILQLTQKKDYFVFHNVSGMSCHKNIEIYSQKDILNTFFVNEYIFDHLNSSILFSIKFIDK